MSLESSKTSIMKNLVSFLAFAEILRGNNDHLCSPLLSGSLTFSTLKMLIHNPSKALKPANRSLSCLGIGERVFSNDPTSRRLIPGVSFRNGFQSKNSNSSLIRAFDCFRMGPNLEWRERRIQVGT